MGLFDRDGYGGMSATEERVRDLEARNEALLAEVERLSASLKQLTEFGYWKNRAEAAEAEVERLQAQLSSRE